MNRKALLISNAGELGADNYCDGVKVDIENYVNFLTSPLGGGWYSHEIETLDRPSVSALKNNLSEIEKADYAFIVFCGHGYYSSARNSTILQLCKNEEIDSIELRSNTTKRTIILDCCREIVKDIITERVIAKFAEAKRDLNFSECRRYFNEAINKCSSSLIVGYACSKDETAGDSASIGGYYSYSILKSAEEWRKNNNVDISKKWSQLNIVHAHNSAIDSVRSLSGNTQNPEIDKPRSKPYFPFAIMA